VKIPFHQNILKLVGFFIAGVFTLGALLDAISNAITIVSPRITFVSTAWLVGIWLLVELVIAFFGIPWHPFIGDRVRVKILGAKFRMALFGMLCLLWLPRLGDLQTDSPMPLLEVRFVNSTDHDINILKRGEFVLWFPDVMSAGAPRIGGKVEFISKDEKPKSSSEYELTVPSKSLLKCFAMFLNEKRFKPILEAGETDLTLMATTSKGRITSPDSPFTLDVIGKKYLRWEVKP
jgi:hypothetical protein